MDPGGRTRTGSVPESGGSGSDETVDRLMREFVSQVGFRGRIAAVSVAEWAASAASSPRDIAGLLAGLAAERACAPISDFVVGCAVVGRSGDVYLGTNLEFEGCALGSTVHAEQSAVALARAAGEAGLEVVIVEPLPCGHCRQFLSETGEPGLEIAEPGKPGRSLASLLPAAFGPADLGVSRSFFDDRPLALVPPPGEDALVTTAFQAARRSWAPYSGCPAGVALETADGDVFTGSSIESAAFNPSLGAMEAALNGLLVSRSSLSGIRAAAMVAVTGPVGLFGSAEAALGSVAHGVPLGCHESRVLEEGVGC